MTAPPAVRLPTKLSSLSYCAARSVTAVFYSPICAIGWWHLKTNLTLTLFFVFFLGWGGVVFPISKAKKTRQTERG